MSTIDTFYPFVDNRPSPQPQSGEYRDKQDNPDGQSPKKTDPSGVVSDNTSDIDPIAGGHLIQPAYPARIAVYDDMAMPPRVVVVEPKEIRAYLQEILDNVYSLMMQQGGTFSYQAIRELVENYIHAGFVEPTVSILDHGQTLVFSDQGPGIPNKQAALKPAFTSATREMKRYIRGVGSGLPTVEEYLHSKGGTITIDDNLGHGAIVTISLVHTSKPDQATPQAQPQAQVNQVLPGYQAAPAYGYSAYGVYPSQQYQPQYPPQQVYGQAYGQPPQGYAPQISQPQQAAAYQAYPYRYPPAQQGYMGSPAGAQFSQQGQYIPAQQQPVPSGYGQYGQPQQIPQQGTAQGQTPQAHIPMSTLTAEQQAIINLFRVSEKIGPAEIEASLGITKPTASRRLGTLAHMGYVIKNGQKYMLTDQGKLLLDENPQQ